MKNGLFVKRNQKSSQWHLTFEWMYALSLFMFVTSCSASTPLGISSFYADGGSQPNYLLNNAFDGHSTTRWMSASPTADPNGGLHQMIRIDLGEKKQFNMIEIRNWLNIDTPLRIFASDILTDVHSMFLSYEANFYPTFSNDWRGPAIARNYELIAEVPRPVSSSDTDRVIRFEFSTVKNRYIYITIEGYHSTSGVRYPQIGEITVSFTDSQMYRVSKSSAADLIQPVFDVFDFGAVGDGQTEDTKAIQAAVDACHKAGKGTVWFHSGIFACAAVQLKSNTKIHIDADSMVLAYTGGGRYDDPEDLYRDKYPGMRQIDLWRDKESTGFTEPEREYAKNHGWLGEQKGFPGPVEHRSIFFAEDAVSITIEGRGVIHGNHHDPLFDRNKRRSQPPYLLRFLDCKNVVVRDVIIMNAIDWSQTYNASDNVIVENVIVDNVGEYPSDGLSILNCRNVTIRNNYIHSDDDCIVVKSIGPPKLVGPTSNILVEDNVVNSLRNRAINIGTETEGPIHNLVFRNNVVTHAGKGGIGIEAVDGSDINDIHYENIFVRSGVPMYMRLGNRNRYHYGKIGSMQNITFKNIFAYGYLNWGCLIAGISDHRIKNVTFSNMWFDVKGGIQNIPALPMDDKEGDYPQENMFDVLPAYGFYVRHAENITFDNVNIRCRNEDAREWIVSQYTQGIKLIDCKQYKKDMFPANYHSVSLSVGEAFLKQMNKNPKQSDQITKTQSDGSAATLTKTDDIKNPSAKIISIIDPRYVETDKFDENIYAPFPINCKGDLPIRDVVCRDGDIINAAVWAIRNNLSVNDRIYGDRQFLISYLPQELQNSTWIRPSMKSKDFQGNTLISFSTNSKVTVYIAYPDYFKVEKPTWLNDWQSTDKYIMIRQGGTHVLWRFILFCKEFEAGAKVSLGSNDMPDLNTMISHVPPTGKEGFRLRAPILYPEQYFVIIK